MGGSECVVDGELDRLPEVSEEGGVAGGVETPVDDSSTEDAAE